MQQEDSVMQIKFQTQAAGKLVTFAVIVEKTVRELISQYSDTTHTISRHHSYCTIGMILQHNKKVI